MGAVPDLPGCLAYGATQQAAVSATVALALRILADRIEHGEAVPDAVAPSFAFHDRDELGPRMLARIGKATGLAPGDLQAGVEAVRDDIEPSE